MRKAIDNIKKNKLFYTVLLLILIVFVYTCSNTFLANDDLPYMFFYRGTTRISNILHAFKNQAVDYFNLNARVIVHFVLQCVLMFDKKLWCILNPIMIVITFFFMVKIIKIYSKSDKNFNNILNLIFICALFLMMFNYKQIIYWGAGSINYVWTYSILISMIYFYLKYGFSKNIFINFISILFISACHETTLVFSIIFIFGLFIIDYFQNKKIDKKFVLYFCALSISLLFIMLSPGNNNRMASDDIWNNMDFITKILTSIPVASKNLFNLNNWTNILPYIFIISILVSFSTTGSKYKRLCTASILAASLLAYSLDSGWIYFILIILLFTTELYINVVKERKNLSLISLSMYAVVFSTIITPLYAVGRPNYFFYLYIIMSSIIYFNDNRIYIKNSGYVLILMSIICSLLVANELYSYTRIGKIYRNRTEQIHIYKQNPTGVLILKKIPDDLTIYHIDSNQPSDSNYFTYRYFIQYYGLPEKTIIQFK